MPCATSSRARCSRQDWPKWKGQGRDGRWDAAYDSVSTAQVPQDLQAALDKNPAAAAMFGKLSSQNRFAILFRLQGAKKPETRAARLDKFVDMLARGDTIHPQREA